ncbi:hypothetical protein MXD81_22125, partial [Microbacteriaceae bacterium K1510]|nr:hypothetical protein [Microbacteriaceae bacterium K1510]
ARFCAAWTNPRARSVNISKFMSSLLSAPIRPLARAGTFHVRIYGGFRRPAGAAASSGNLSNT